METITNSLEMEFQASEGANVKVTLYDQKSAFPFHLLQILFYLHLH